jgi:hypothetical protein
MSTTHAGSLATGGFRGPTRRGRARELEAARQQRLLAELLDGRVRSAGLLEERLDRDPPPTAFVELNRRLGPEGDRGGRPH